MNERFILGKSLKMDDLMTHRQWACGLSRRLRAYAKLEVIPAGR
jgi:hypothetical protein